MASKTKWWVKFSSQPFIQKSLKKTQAVQSRSLCSIGRLPNQTQVESHIHRGQCLEMMTSLWFEEDPSTMNCADLGRSPGRGKKELPRDPWATTVDGKMVKLLLCDQILDNCFCGTQEAFAYDAPRWRIAYLAQTVSSKDSCAVDLRVNFTSPFILHGGGLMHPRRAQTTIWPSLLEYAAANSPGRFKRLVEYQWNLKSITRMLWFSRYPHRNAVSTSSRGIEMASRTRRTCRLNKKSHPKNMMLYSFVRSR
jgi:uncharacterized protein (DUF924 family)